jgi:adenosine deaminase
MVITSHERRQQLSRMPKVDLHRHLEGSIRLTTLLDVAQQYNIPLPADDLESLRPHVQMMESDPPTVERFMSKFGVLRRFFRSPEIVQRVTREAIEDAAQDNVRYLELRFTPFALASQMHYSLDDVIGWVCEAAADAAQVFGIQVGLIVSMNRHERIELGLQAVKAALNHHGHGVVGLDLAGRETGFPARPFGPLFLEARQAGLGITVHAGEWHGPENVRDAIEHMYADRIGHGVRVVEDSQVVQLAINRGVVFEVCPTSNLQTGSVADAMYHPLRDLHYLDLPLTINTDDPAISNINLTDEFVLAVELLGFALADLRRYILTAAEASFLPIDEKVQLFKSLQQELEDFFAAHVNGGNGTYSDQQAQV